MIWILYAILSAFLGATIDTISKKILKNNNEYMVLWARNAFTLPFLFLILIFFSIPEIDNKFWIALAITLPLEIFLAILYIKAIKITDLSLSIPFLSFGPIFTIITSFLILKEFPTIYGFIGIILITIGAYFLNFEKIKINLFQPFKSIIKEKGSLFMLIVSLISAIVITIEKIGIISSSP